MEKTLFVWNIMMNKKNADSIVFLFRRQQLKHNYAPVTDPLTHQYIGSRFQSCVCILPFDKYCHLFSTVQAEKWTMNS